MKMMLEMIMDHLRPKRLVKGSWKAAPKKDPPCRSTSFVSCQIARAVRRMVETHLEERGHIRGSVDVVGSTEGIFERFECDRSTDCRSNKSEHLQSTIPISEWLTETGIVSKRARKSRKFSAGPKTMSRPEPSEREFSTHPYATAPMHMADEQEGQMKAR